MYNRMQRALDQIGPVVEDFQFYVGWKRRLDVRQPLFHSLDDGAAVFTEEHHHNSRDDLSAAVASSRALAGEGGDGGLGDFANQDGTLDLAAAEDRFYAVI